MDWLDYRKALGIGFDDSQKVLHFTTNFLSYFESLGSPLDSVYNVDEHFKFCIMTGTQMVYGQRHYIRIIEDILDNSRNKFVEFISLLIAFINSLRNDDSECAIRDILKEITEGCLKRAHIPFEIYLDEEMNYFIFPKGAKELDDSLVSETLSWLKDYPETRKSFSIALKQYSDGQYPRDVADNLRKTLEVFLQEFLRNNKNLESNKTEICKKLSELNVDSSLSSLYSTVINTYKNSNDANAKHNDRIDKDMLEFLLYQTGLLIRAVITAKNYDRQNMV